MSVLTEEALLQDLDFKCARCQAECTKINVAEPEKGYVSKADGSFVGPLCDNCYKQIPEQEKVIRQLPESAFLVVIRPGGEGAYITTEGIGLTYQREATFNDIMTACDIVKRDVHDALFAQKLTNQFMRTMAMAQKSPSKLVLPK